MDQRTSKDLIKDISSLKGETLIPLKRRFCNQKTINDINKLIERDMNRIRLDNVQFFYQNVICHNKSHEKSLYEYRSINTIQQLEDYLVNPQKKEEADTTSQCPIIFRKVQMQNPLIYITEQLERLQQVQEQKQNNDSCIEQPDQFEKFIKKGILYVEVEPEQIQKLEEKEVPSLVNAFLLKQNSIGQFLQNQIYLKQKFDEPYVKIRMLQQYPSYADVILVVRGQKQQNILYGTYGVINLDEKFEITSDDTGIKVKLYQIFEKKFINEWELMTKIQFGIQAIYQTKDYAFLAQNYSKSNIQNIKNIYVKTINLVILIEELDFWIGIINKTLINEEINYKSQDEKIKFPQDQIMNYQKNKINIDRLQTFLSKSCSDIDAQQFEISKYQNQQSNDKMYFYKIQNDAKTLLIEYISKGEKNTAYLVYINKNTEQTVDVIGFSKDLALLKTNRKFNNQKQKFSIKNIESQSFKKIDGQHLRIQ